MDLLFLKNDYVNKEAQGVKRINDFPQVLYYTYFGHEFILT